MAGDTRMTVYLQPKIYRALKVKSATTDRSVSDNLAAMTTGERAVFEETYVPTRLALDIGEKLRNAREAANLSQREFGARMRIGEAAVARLEAGDVGAKLAMIQKVATALHLRITVELSTSS